MNLGVCRESQYGKGEANGTPLSLEMPHSKAVLQLHEVAVGPDKGRPAIFDVGPLKVLIWMP